MQKTSKLSLAVLAGVAGLGLAFATVSPAVAAGTQYVCVSSTSKFTVRAKCLTGEKKLFTVPTSIVGPAGPAGVAGPAGPAGATGSSGVTGATGPTGAAGANGLDGAVGPQGPAGADGLNGVDGVNGIDGAVGPQGPAGADGLNGVDGVNGLDGTDGVGYNNAVDGNACQVDVDGAGPNPALVGVLDITETVPGNGIWGITCVVAP
jgi:hypothetical protein